jgi:tetratricopeptide (TPR) repeat protein
MAKIFLGRLILSCTLTICGAAAAGGGQGDAPTPPLLPAPRRAAQSGRVAEAIQLYRRVVKLTPARPDALRELAGLLAGAGETRGEAERWYREAALLQPQDAALALERAANLAALGDTVNAILEYRRAFEAEPGNEAALRAFIEQTAKIGGAAAAIERARKKAAESPDDVATRLLLAELWLSEGRVKAAQDQFQSARRIAPDSLPALRGAVRACLAAQDFECAAKQLTQLAELTAGAPTERARLLLASRRPEAALQALAASQAGEAEAAPGVAALEVLADCYRARGDLRGEQSALEHLLRLPDAPTVSTLERLARARFDAGDRPAARAAIEQLLSLDPGNAVGLIGRRLLPDAPPSGEGLTTPARQLTVRQNVAARRAARALAEGEAALFWQRPAEAVAPLRSALAEWPSSPRLRLALGQALLQTGDAEGAVKEFVSVIAEEGKERLDALMLLARAQEARGRPQHALSIYESVLARDSNHLPALHGQAEVNEQLGETGRVAAALSRIARRAPEDVVVRERLQAAFVALGRPAELNSPPRAHAADAAPAAAPVEPLLNVGDVVKIRIGGRAFGEALKIDERGWLQIAAARTTLDARCRTTNEVGARIAQLLALTPAGVVEVEAVEFRRAPLTVAGAVYLPDDFYVKQPLDLRQSLLLAGGLQESAGQAVFVLRHACACPPRAPQPPDDAREGRVEVYDRRTAAAESTIASSSTAPRLGPGDFVYAPRQGEAFIAGEVVSPTLVAARGGLTLLRAVRQANGTTPTARRDYVRLLRLKPDRASFQEFILNLDEIERRQVGDVLLREGDVVEIPARGASEERLSAFARQLRRLAQNLPQSAMSQAAATTASKK